MDTAAINTGGAPLKPMLDKIDAVKNIKELMELNMSNYAAGEGNLLGFVCWADDKNSAANIPVFTPILVCHFLKKDITQERSSDSSC